MTSNGHLLVASLMALVCSVQTSSAQDLPGAQVAPFHYFEGFEIGEDPVQFWLSYGKAFTVNFKGTTTEMARSGQRSFKLDVTFEEESRFLWHIPLVPQVPVGGRLAFSGHMLLGEETTGRATLGVSFRFPPTVHSGCTRPYDFHGPTQGEWVAVGDDFVARSREIAGSIMGAHQAGIGAEHVGVYLERVIIDLRGEAGQRVVLYVDDLEISGEAPTEDAYREEMARRWAPAQQAFDERLAAWRTSLDRAEALLAGMADLSPQAESVRSELAESAREARAAVEAAGEAGTLRAEEAARIEGALTRLAHVPAVQALSAAERAGRSALIWVTPPISANMILPHDRLVAGEVSSELRVVAARGQYEPASFVVSALSDLDALTVSVGDLHGDAGGLIGADSVDVRVVKCWYQAGTAWVGIRQDKSRRVLTPELLLRDPELVRVDEENQENYLKLRFPDGDRYVWISDPTDVPRGGSLPVEEFPVQDSPALLPVNIPEGRLKQFWVTVHVPDDAASGAYTGAITLATAEEVVAELTLEVRVLPFDLEPPYYTSSMDYHGRPTSEKGTIGSWLKSWTQFRAELENMVAHGLNNCQHYNIPKDILGQVLEVRREVGMDNRALYLKNTIPIGNPTDPEALEAIKANVRDIIEFVRPYGVETVYFYGIDELRGEELMAQRAAWEAVREAGGRIFVAGWGDNVETMADIQDMHVRSGWPNRDEVARWHALGHRIFSYNNPQTGVENPVVYRRNFGLLLWKYDYDGAATNAYQHTFGTTWNDFDHPTYRAHTIAYPTVNGVVDTIAWEGYREGVDDVRYVTTLQNAVEAARASGDPARLRAAEAAADFLRRLKTGTDIETGDLDDMRGQIIKHILALGDAAG